MKSGYEDHLPAFIYASLVADPIQQQQLYWTPHYMASIYASLVADPNQQQLPPVYYGLLIWNKTFPTGTLSFVFILYPLLFSRLAKQSPSLSIGSTISICLTFQKGERDFVKQPSSTKMLFPTEQACSSRYVDQGSSTKDDFTIDASQTNNNAVSVSTPMFMTSGWLDSNLFRWGNDELSRGDEYARDDYSTVEATNTAYTSVFGGYSFADETAARSAIISVAHSSQTESRDAESVSRAEETEHKQKTAENNDEGSDDSLSVDDTMWTEECKRKSDQEPFGAFMGMFGWTAGEGKYTIKQNSSVVSSTGSAILKGDLHPQGSKEGDSDSEVMVLWEQKTEDETQKPSERKRRFKPRQVVQKFFRWVKSKGKRPAAQSDPSFTGKSHDNSGIVGNVDPIPEAAPTKKKRRKWIGRLRNPRDHPKSEEVTIPVNLPKPKKVSKPIPVNLPMPKKVSKPKKMDSAEQSDGDQPLEECSSALRYQIKATSFSMEHGSAKKSDGAQHGKTHSETTINTILPDAMAVLSNPDSSNSSKKMKKNLIDMDSMISSSAKEGQTNAEDNLAVIDEEPNESLVEGNLTIDANESLKSSPPPHQSILKTTDESEIKTGVPLGLEASSASLSPKDQTKYDMITKSEEESQTPETLGDSLLTERQKQGSSSKSTTGIFRRLVQKDRDSTHYHTPTKIGLGEMVSKIKAEGIMNGPAQEETLKQIVAEQDEGGPTKASSSAAEEIREAMKIISATKRLRRITMIEEANETQTNSQNLGFCQATLCFCTES